MIFGSARGVCRPKEEAAVAVQGTREPWYFVPPVVTANTTLMPGDLNHP